MPFKLLIDYDRIVLWRDKHNCFKNIKLQIREIKEKIDILDVNMKKIEKATIQIKIDTLNTTINSLSNLFLILDEVIKLKLTHLKDSLKNKLREIDLFLELRCSEIVKELEIIKEIIINPELDLVKLTGQFKILKINLSNEKKINPLMFCKSALVSIYEFSTWLRNFSIESGVIFEKITTKCKTELSQFYTEEICIGNEIKALFVEYGKIN